MAACEKCWAEYSFRVMCGERVEYQDVLREREAAGKGCTPAEQCGDLHVTIDGRCRCGHVTPRPEGGRSQE